MGFEPGKYVYRRFTKVFFSENWPKDIVGCIAGETKIRGSEIGKIDIFEQFSFVEVPKDRANMVHRTLGGVSLKGRSMNIEPAKGR